MAVPVSLRSKISNVMQLNRNKDSWMNINPEMRDELEMAYEGQMGQLKNELGSEVRSMGIPRRPDYPGGEAINRSQPTLIGGAVGKIGELMGGLGKKIVGEGYGQELGVSYAGRVRKAERAHQRVRKDVAGPDYYRSGNAQARKRFGDSLDRVFAREAQHGISQDIREYRRRFGTDPSRQDLKDMKDLRSAEQEGEIAWHESGASADAWLGGAGNEYDLDASRELIDLTEAGGFPKYGPVEGREAYEGIRSKYVDDFVKGELGDRYEALKAKYRNPEFGGRASRKYMGDFKKHPDSHEEQMRGLNDVVDRVKRGDEDLNLGIYASGAGRDKPITRFDSTARQTRIGDRQSQIENEIEDYNESLDVLTQARMAQGRYDLPASEGELAAGSLLKDAKKRKQFYEDLASQPHNPELSLTSRSRWDDEFERHKREIEGQDWGADEAQRKSIRNINDEIGKLESHSRELADELSWIEDNKDALDPETYRTERIRIMGEWGKNTHRIRQLQGEKKKVGVVGRRDEAIEEPQYPTRYRPNDYDHWDPATQLEYDKMVQDIQHLDGRLEHTMNPDIRRALLADRFERAKAFKKRFGGDYDPQISPSKPPKYGKGSEQDRGDKLREMMTKTMYGSKGSARPILDMVGNVYRRAAEPDATSVSSDRGGSLLEDLQGFGSAAATASMVAGKGAIKAAIPQTAMMMGLEEYTKDAPPPINIGGRLRFRGKGPRKVEKSGRR